jgi:hypothetical protein
MAGSNKGADRRERQANEIEANQAELRASIAESERLVGEADTILRRHRKECEEDEAARARARLSDNTLKDAAE